MPVTSRPDTGNNIIWLTGDSETSLAVASGQTKRVTTNQDISIRDINSIRAAIEALSVHAHDYSDAVGVGGGC